MKELDLIAENIEKLKNVINIELDAIIEDVCPGYLKKEITPKIIDVIINTICDYFNINKKILLTSHEVIGSGVEELVRMRQVISLIAYNDYGYSANEIGETLFRTHATIINSKKRAKNYYETELTFKIDVDNCRKLLDKKFKR